MSNAASYLSAPATKLLATKCACCSRPLLDAVSVETGVGPDCRKNHGYGAADMLTDWAGVDAVLEGTDALEVIKTEKIHPRLAANYLVYLIAAEQNGVNVHRYTAALARLGFRTLAGRVALRIRGVVVTADGAELLVKAPFSARFRGELRFTRVTASFDKKADAWRVPATEARALFAAIKGGFPRGTVVVGSKGATVLLPRQR